MFTDIQGFTEKMNRRESMGFKLLKTHNEIMDTAVAAHGGRVVKSLGDSYLVAFDSVVNAARCAIQAQEAFEKVNRSGKLPEPLLVRISIHLGDVVMREKDVFGDGVNLASHLQDVTPGGAICVSQDAYSQIRGKIPGTFKSMGFCRIKGVQEPIEVYRVLPAGEVQASIETPARPLPMTGVVAVRPARRPVAWIAVVAALFALAFAAWLLH